MEKKKIKKILANVKYSKNSIDKIMQEKMKPKLEKAIEMEENYGLPCIAWKSIKSYLDETIHQKAS